MFFAAVVAPASGQMHTADPEALRVMSAMVEAYRSGTGFDVRTSLRIGAIDDAGEVFEPPILAHWILLPEQRLRGEFGGYTVRLGEGELQAIHESREGLFHKAPDGDSPYYALMQRFVDLPWPTLALGVGEEAPDEVSMQMHTRAPWLQPTKVALINEGDEPRGRLTLSSDYETMTLDFDPATHLLRTAEVVVHDGPFVSDDVDIIYQYEFVVTPLEKGNGDPTLIDLQGRQHADSVQALVQEIVPEGGQGGEKLRRGRKAPSLALPELDGGTLDIAKLTNRLLVIDFWATWCGPCRQALPEMAALARWAKMNDLPVDVIAVNTAEQSTTLEGRRERVGDFCKERGNQLDGLRIVLDVDGKTAKRWGVNGLPTTIILDADGRVVSVRSGFRAGEGERLKEELLDLFEGAEEAPRGEVAPRL